MVLWYQIAFFYEKKNFFLQNFCDFWVFLKFRSMVAKSETGTWFFRIFRTFWHLYWPWVCVRIEMGNLLAKTPCVMGLICFVMFWYVMICFGILWYVVICFCTWCMFWYVVVCCKKCDPLEPLNFWNVLNYCFLDSFSQITGFGLCFNPKKFRNHSIPTLNEATLVSHTVTAPPIIALD